MNKNFYKYTDGDITNKKYIKANKKKIYYYEPNQIKDKIEKDNSLILGCTNFKMEKDKENLLVIDSEIYTIKPLLKEDIKKVIGYIEVEEGFYIAIFKDKTIFFLWFFLFLLCILFSIFLCKDSENPINSLKKDWIIGGIEGTDVSLSPEKETTYNTYWGYQEITIDKTMKVPVVNKETNTAYAQFTLYDKQGNQIWQSVLIKPGSRDEWDAYQYYEGVSGTYLHDLKVVFYTPIYEDDEIVDFIPSMFAATTPDFTVHIKE